MGYADRSEWRSAIHDYLRECGVERERQGGARLTASRMIGVDDRSYVSRRLHNQDRAYLRLNLPSR
jgi:hypothetical protein